MGTEQTNHLNSVSTNSPLTEEDYTNFLLHREAVYIKHSFTAGRRWKEGELEYELFLAKQEGDIGIERLEQMLFSEKFAKKEKEEYNKLGQGTKYEDFDRQVKVRILETLGTFESHKATALFVKFYYGNLQEVHKLSRNDQVDRILKYRIPDKDSLVTHSYFAKIPYRKCRITTTEELDGGKKYKIHFSIANQGSEELVFEARKISDTVVWIPGESKLLGIY
jgi:hypothetical protein